MNLLKNKMGMRVLTLALCAALGGSVLAVKAESVAGETVVQEAVQDENMSESREIAHPAQEAAETVDSYPIKSGSSSQKTPSLAPFRYLAFPSFDIVIGALIFVDAAIAPQASFGASATKP